MQYAHTAIPDASLPRALFPIFQHLIDTYASESNKVASVWESFTDSDLLFRPDDRSSTVRDIFRHQLLSERRFFGEFLGAPEPETGKILPAADSAAAYRARFVELAIPRLQFIARQTPEWWTVVVPFFDVERERIWIFWRRVLHTTHHRTQLTRYLRAMGKPVPSTYGPTADVTWTGADPTHTPEAAARR
jgi:uncharacterized damage-inducible protein DinB